MASFISRTTSTVLLIYKTYIRSVLDYASPSWSPYHATQIASLEYMQKRVIAIIDDIDQDQLYSDKLKQLRLYSLQRRRERYDLCILYKYLKAGQIYLNIEISRGTDIPRNHRHNRHLRDSAPLLPYEKIKTVREETFIPRAIKSWNQLPPHIVEAPKFTAFKIRLDNLLSGLEDIPLPEPGPTHTTLLEQAKRNRLSVRLQEHWRRPPTAATSPSRPIAC